MTESVRHQMPFEEKMLGRFAEIVRLDDAMAILCEELGETECDNCPLENQNGIHCNRKFMHGMIEDIKKEMPVELRQLIGDPAPYCSPCEPTQPECGKCKGDMSNGSTGAGNVSKRAGEIDTSPKCPKCGGPTFLANIDDQDMILCYNDACKWKGPAEIGQCEHGERIGEKIRCILAGVCQYQKPDKINDGTCWFVCTREDAALAAIERYE